MRQINLDRPLWIAAHFGFIPIEPPSITPEDEKITKDCEDPLKDVKNKLTCNAPEKAAFLRQNLERFLSSSEPFSLSWRRGHEYTLELVGYPVGVAEAKLIRASLSILTDEGYKDLVVEINSIGDKESISAYDKELRNFLSKTTQEIDAELKKMFKEDPFTLAKAPGNTAENLRKEMPPSISHLSSQSRAHLKEVLEYLEALGVDYRFAPELLGHKNLCSETLFAIRDGEGVLLAAGFRYSRLSRRFGIKKDLSLIGTTIYGRRQKEGKIYKEAPRAKFYLIHLGREARLKTLPLIELLRSFHIPIYHFLGHEKLASQMQTPEAIRTPYHLIIGQKEALENTVTVRNVSSRAQDTVPMDALPNYLKHLPF